MQFLIFCVVNIQLTMNVISYHANGLTQDGILRCDSHSKREFFDFELILCLNAYFNNFSLEL